MMSGDTMTEAEAIGWLLKAPELSEDRAVQVMMDVVAKLYGLSLDQQARVLATIAACVCAEAHDPSGAVEDFVGIIRRQIDAVSPIGNYQ